MSSLVRSLFGDFDVFTTSLPSGHEGHSRGAWLPAANVLESGDGYAIEISAPGMSRADFKISAEEGRLTITGNRVQPNEDVGKYIRQEFGFSQEFSRSWSLPAGVDAGSIAARYESGILRVTVPVDRKRRRVEVRID